MALISELKRDYSVNCVKCVHQSVKCIRRIRESSTQVKTQEYKYSVYLSRKVELLERRVLADVAADHSLYLSRLEQQTESVVGHSRRVRDDGQTLHIRLLQCLDQLLRDAAQTEPCRTETCLSKYSTEMGITSRMRITGIMNIRRMFILRKFYIYIKPKSIRNEKIKKSFRLCE